MTLTDNKADDLRERLDIINGKITEYRQSLIEVRDAVKGTFVSTEEERKLNLAIANLELLKGEILLRFSGFVLIDRKKLAEERQNFLENIEDLRTKLIAEQKAFDKLAAYKSLDASPDKSRSAGEK